MFYLKSYIFELRKAGYLQEEFILYTSNLKLFTLQILSFFDLLALINKTMVILSFFGVRTLVEVCLKYTMESCQIALTAHFLSH